MLSIFLFTFFFFVVVFGAGLAMRVLLRPSCTLHETNTRGSPEGNGLAHVIPVAIATQDAMAASVAWCVTRGSATGAEGPLRGDEKSAKVSGGACR